MRKPQSQLWGTLFLFGTLAAVSCTNDGKTEGPLGGPDTPMAPGADSPVPTPPSKVDPTPGVEQPPPSQAETPKPGEQKPDESKEPDAPAVAVAALEVVASCDEAASFIRERALATMNARIDALKKSNFGGGFCPVPQASAPPGGTPPPNAPARGDSATPGGASATSMTNNQVAGVDEADFIKNDNEYVYAAMNGAFRIVRAWPAAEAREVANLKLEGTPKKLFVLEDRALVYLSLPRTAADDAKRPGLPGYVTDTECTYGYDCQFDGDGTATALLVFDITDRAAPKQVRRIDLSSSLLAARRIGSAVHTVAVMPELQFPGLSYSIDEAVCGQVTASPERDAKFEALRKKNTEIIEKTALSSFLPSVRENDVDHGQNDCSSLYREVTPTGTAFTSVISLDMKANDPPKVSTVLSKPGAVYASGQSLYMAVISDFPPVFLPGFPGGIGIVPPASTPTERKLTSAIHKFSIGSDPKATGYLASGEVKGHVLNQFSMDEHEGNLRVATSWGKVPSPDVHSTISVLSQREDNLAVVGMVDKIAPSEDIRSVRFDGDRGFIVTFKKTDPLYAFDLSDPSAPKITGELKIPGFSTYMHMLDANHLLTIGYDAADQGDFAFFTGVLLQIFDVSDPANLELAHKISIGTRGTSSEALTNHLAFTLFQGKLAVPMTICEGGDTNGGFGSNMTFSGLMLFDVSVTDGLRERGRVAHPNGTGGGAYDNMGCSNWWTRASSVVQRSVFMDDFVYSIAQDVMRVQNVNSLGRDVAAVSLDE